MYFHTSDKGLLQLAPPSSPSFWSFRGETVSLKLFTASSTKGGKKQAKFDFTSTELQMEVIVKRIHRVPHLEMSPKRFAVTTNDDSAVLCIRAVTTNDDSAILCIRADPLRSSHSRLSVSHAFFESPPKWSQRCFSCYMACAT